MPERSGKRRKGGGSQRRAAYPRKGQPKHEEAASDEERPSIRPQWSGTLSFGLVSIPVDLYPATRSGGVSLRMLSSEGTPLKRRFVCPEEDVEVPYDELVRGYEVKAGEYVVVSDEELEALEPQKSRDIDLRLFVAADSVSPLYFVRSYFLVASGDSSKAYHLLASVMEKKQQAGIATFIMRDREHLVAITADGGLLKAHALRFHDELRAEDEVPLPKKPELDPAEVERFAKLIDRQAKTGLDLDQMQNEAADQLRELAEKKGKRSSNVIELEGAEAEESGEASNADVIDLMQILKRSLAK